SNLAPATKPGCISRTTEGKRKEPVLFPRLGNSLAFNVSQFIISLTTGPLGSLHKGDLVDLLEGGDPKPNLLQRRLTQCHHAFLPCHPANLRTRFLVKNKFAHAVREGQQFTNGSASTEPRLVARLAPNVLVE